MRNANQFLLQLEKKEGKHGKELLAHLTNWSMRISKIYKEVVTFQIKVDYVFRMQIFHTKGNIHCNQEPLALVKISDKKEFCINYLGSIQSQEILKYTIQEE